MAIKTNLLRKDMTVGLGGIVEIPHGVFETLGQVKVNGRGIVLADERLNVDVEHSDGRIVGYVMSIYIQRAPITDKEASDVATAKAEGEASKNKRKADDQATRDREIKRAQELGQDAAFSAINRIGSGMGEAAALLNAAGQRR